MAWFKNWFDSKYYHILYKKRNHAEAILLIDNLLNQINPPKNSMFLDLACGTGRHAIYLSKRGFKEEGFDLSKKSLEKAKQNENKNLKFYSKDIRNFKKNNTYNFVLNLFTSFGYFEDEKDNKKVFKNVQESLKRGGLFIIDFFNATKVISELKNYETKKIDDITFEIHKTYDKDFVYKEICITDRKNKHTFTEKVRLINKNQFIDYTKDLNMELLKTFGDYYLNDYHEANSQRLLLVFQKKK